MALPPPVPSPVFSISSALISPRENQGQTPGFQSGNNGALSVYQCGLVVKTLPDRILAPIAGKKLAAHVKRFHIAPMIFSEIKPQIEQLPHDEMLKALAYLKHLLRAENADYQKELAQRHADIQAGHGISLTEAKRRLHNS